MVTTEIHFYYIWWNTPSHKAGPFENALKIFNHCNFQQTKLEFSHDVNTILCYFNPLTWNWRCCFHYYRCCCCRCEVDLHETVFAAPIFGLGITDDAVYFGTYYDGAVLSVRLHRGKDAEQPGEQQREDREEPDVPVIEIKDLTTRELFSIAINDPDLQPIGESAVLYRPRCPYFWETMWHSPECVVISLRTKKIESRHSSVLDNRPQCVVPFVTTPTGSDQPPGFSVDPFPLKK